MNAGAQRFDAILRTRGRRDAKDGHHLPGKDQFEIWRCSSVLARSIIRGKSGGSGLLVEAGELRMVNFFLVAPILVRGSSRSKGQPQRPGTLAAPSMRGPFIAARIDGGGVTTLLVASTAVDDLRGRNN